MNFKLLDGDLAVARLEADWPIPAWVLGAWYSVTRTANEISIVCPADQVPENVRQQGPWRAMEIEGPLDFAEIGILAAISDTLKRASVSIFVLSTFDTDIILVATEDLTRAVTALRVDGHQVQGA